MLQCTECGREFDDSEFRVNYFICYDCLVEMED
jgi:hypothetical protein